MEEVAIYESKPLTAKDIKNQVDLIQDVMKGVMKDHEHYGVIPGCGDKPALLKPGAEKLNLTFRMAPDPETVIIDMGEGHREYRVKCIMKSIETGKFLGAGVGSASTMETKWRFRKGEQKCPKCGKEAIIKGKQEYGGGWLCFKKKGGCGEKFKDGDSTIENQEMGRIEYDNPADYYNCVTPDTKVLTHDLQWVPAGEIESGDMLIGVEENLTNEYSRNFTVGEATVNGRRLEPLYEMTFEDGRCVRCNGEHKWLVKKIGLKGTEWVATKAIHKEITERKGRPRNWSVMSICTPWKEDTSKEAGYIAGLFDADGSLGMKHLMVLFSQQSNSVLAQMQSGLKERGYKFGIGACRTEEQIEQSVSKEPVYSLRLQGGFREQIRLLGSIRPPRLLERWLRYELKKRRLEGSGSGSGKPTRIVSVESIGDGEVVLLGTDCHTYIADGLVCHNTCWKMAKKRALVDGVLTVTAASDIFTQDIEEMAENGTIPGGKESSNKKTPPKAPTEENPKSIICPKNQMDIDESECAKCDQITSCTAMGKAEEPQKEAERKAPETKANGNFTICRKHGDVEDNFKVSTKYCQTTCKERKTCTVAQGLK